MKPLDRGHDILEGAHRELTEDINDGTLNRLRCELLDYRRAAGDEWSEFAKSHFPRHPLCGLLHESPFARRSYARPRGYAGDAVTLDYIYGHIPVDDASHVGQAVYDWENRTANSRSVRARRELVASRVRLRAPGRCPASCRWLAATCGKRAIPRR